MTASQVQSQRSYRYFVEYNYYRENSVLYSGETRLADTGAKSIAVPHFLTDSAVNCHIIDEVSTTGRQGAIDRINHALSTTDEASLDSVPVRHSI